MIFLILTICILFDKLKLIEEYVKIIKLNLDEIGGKYEF